ncbi:MAG: hypothetical protein E7514_05795 [Ruminococcaceae bacterium]|jgi:hypothetical protein|nr:hypothetical protein [Oscillospiraceae bacterium]
MAKTKKALSLVLAVVMVLSLFAINAFAAGEEATFTVTSSAAQVATNDIITITVKASSNSTYYAGPMSIPVIYDSSAFEYVANSVSVANIFGATATDSVVNTTTAGKIIVALSPLTANSPTAPNLTTELTIFTFQLKAIGSSGSYTIDIDNDQKTDSHPTGKFYCGNFDGPNAATANLTRIGQTLNRVGAPVSFGPVGTCELILTATGETKGTVIDRTTTCNDYDGYVYGIDTLIDGEDIADFVTTVVGSVEIEENANGVYSTGALIKLKDAGGNVIETYVFVYFGDVTMDGAVDLDDGAAIAASEAYIEMLEDGTAPFLAGDVTMDMATDLDDTNAIEAQESYISELPTQYEIAAFYASNI